MTWLLQLFIGVSALLGAGLCDGECVRAVLGKPFRLPENCQNDEQGQLLRSETHGEVEVAVHQRGVWTPAPGYQDQISQRSSIVFNRAFYNDSGAYVLKCDGREMHIQVKVLVPSNVTVKEGESALLPCNLPCIDPVSVLWVKGGKIVLKKNSCTDEGNWTAVDRLSVSPDRDICLKVRQAKREDRGDYFCYIQGGEGVTERFYLSVVRLKVMKTASGSCTPTPPPVTPTLEISQEEPQ